MVELILAIAGIALTLAGYGVQEINASVGNDIKGKLTKLGNQLYTKIQNNQRLLDKLYNAYQSRDSSLTNSILTSAGFGPAVEALRKARKENQNRYDSKKEELGKEMTEDTNKYNEVNNAIAQAGTSIAGNQGASNVYENMKQSINGGLQDAKEI